MLVEGVHLTGDEVLEEAEALAAESRAALAPTRPDPEGRATEQLHETIASDLGALVTDQPQIGKD